MVQTANSAGDMVAVVRIAQGNVCDAVRRAMSLAGGLDGIVSAGDRVLLKPNFVGPYRKAVTSFDVIRAVVEAVREHGGVPFLCESSGYEFDTNATLRILSVRELAEEIGIEVVNPEEDGFVEVKTPGGPLSTWRVARSAREADCIINLPKLKGHSLSGMTIGAKNLMGLLHRATRKRMHILGLTRAIPALPGIFRPALTVVDGSTTLGRAVFSDEEPLAVILASRNVLAVDLASLDVVAVPRRRARHIDYAARGVSGLAPARLVGDTDFTHPMPDMARAGLGSRLHRALMWALYAADMIFEPLLRGQSLIPLAHWYFGVRPSIIRARCDACGECAAVCPVDAVDVPSKRIRRSACMVVRCMRCLEACPLNAIKLAGLRKPKRAARPDRSPLT